MKAIGAHVSVLCLCYIGHGGCHLLVQHRVAVSVFSRGQNSQISNSRLSLSERERIEEVQSRTSLGSVHPLRGKVSAIVQSLVIDNISGSAVACKAYTAYKG